MDSRKARKLMFFSGSAGPAMFAAVVASLAGIQQGYSHMSQYIKY